MRHILMLLVIVVSMVSGAEIIKNGDFSEGLNYWHVNKEAEISPTVKAGGKNAVCITRGNGVIQNVAIEPDGIYELSFLVKGENISAANPGKHGGRIILNAGKNYGRCTANDDGSCMTGTFDWKRGVYRFNASKFNSRRLNLNLYLDADGKCYYADVKLKKVGMEKKQSKQADNQFFRESYRPDYPLPNFYPIDEAYGLVEPGKQAQFKLELQMLDGLEYTLVVKNELNEIVFEQGRRPYSENETITVPGQKRGYYILEAQAFVKDEKIAFVQSAFVSTPAMKGRRDPFFRVNQFGIWTPLMEGYRMLGIGSATLPIIGNEKGDPAKNAQKRFLGTYKKFLDSDFELHALYVGGMSQRDCDMDLFKKGYPIYTLEYLKNIEATVTEAAKILKGKVKSYGSIMEIPSSAQMKHKHAGTWTEAMSKQLFSTRIVSRAARSVDPDAKITAGGNNMEMFIEPIERIVMTDLADDFDIYNIDGYFGNWDLTNGKPNVPERSLRSFYMKSSELAKSLGKSPMVQNTETGYNIFYGCRYDQGLAVTQAYLTARAMVISKSAPVSSVALFRLSTHYGFDEKKPLSGCFATAWKPGHADNGKKLTYTPLPGGAAFATFARELAFVKFFREIKSSDNIMYAYVFTRPDGRTLLCIWCIDGEYDLDMPLDEKALLVNMYGRESVLSAGSAKIRLTMHPLYLVTNEAPENMAAKVTKNFEAFRPQYKSAAKLVSPTSAMLYVNNVTNETITVKVAGKSFEIMPCTIGNMLVGIETGQNNIEFTINGKKMSARIINNTVRFTKANGMAKVDDNGNFPKGRITGRLCVPDNVKPVSALHPELSYFKSSQNPNGHDISAEYCLNYDSKNIYICVKVDDPVHVQRFTKDNLWRGDSVQFVFANAPAPPAAVRNMDTSEALFNSGHNYSVGLTAKGTEIVKYYTRQHTQATAEVVRKGNNTIYQIAIPMSEIDAAPGKPLYFDFVVFDNNSKTANSAPYWLDMDDGLAGNRDNAALPLVIFETGAK